MAHELLPDHDAHQAAYDMDGAKEATVRLAIRSAQEFPIAKTVGDKSGSASDSRMAAGFRRTGKADNCVTETQDVAKDLRQ